MSTIDFYAESIKRAVDKKFPVDLNDFQAVLMWLVVDAGFPLCATGLVRLACIDEAIRLARSQMKLESEA